MSTSPVLRRLRQEDHHVASLGYKVNTKVAQATEKDLL